MAGIPYGLGAHKLPGGLAALYMNHKLGNAVLSEPNVGGPLDRGAFISRWVLGKSGCAISGERACDVVVDEANGITLPAPQVDNSTPGFSRFCSASLSFREAGLDRPMYFTVEETNPRPRSSPTTLSGDSRRKQIHLAAPLQPVTGERHG